MDDALLAEDEYDTSADVSSEDLYGETYNKKFLDELARIKAEKGADYFRHYPTKDEIMGDNLKPLWDEIHNSANMGKGEHKEVSTMDQHLGH